METRKKQIDIQEIIITEYQNYVTSDRFPMGHGKKALKEAYQLINVKPFRVKCVASQIYCDFKSDNIKYINEIVRNKQHKFIRLFRVFKNLKYIFQVGRNKIIWFTNVDWMFFVYVSLFSPREQKMAVTVFRDILEDARGAKWGICKNLLFHLVSNGMSKIDLVFVTNPILSINECKQQIHIPDYYYKPFYDSYRCTAKTERIVCLGLMGAKKELEKLVRHFNDTEIEVWIMGIFDNEEYYNTIKKISRSNIKIENRSLSEKEYLDVIGSSQFVILPYTATEYKAATSGILLETIFVQSIPIAPNFLLRNNNIQGIGYEKLEDIPTTLKELKNIGTTIHNSIDDYQFDHIQSRVIDAFLKMANMEII